MGEPVPNQVGRCHSSSLLLVVPTMLELPRNYRCFFPLVLNPGGFLWGLPASTLFLSLFASTVHLLLHPSWYTIKFATTWWNLWCWIPSRFLPVVTLTLTCLISTNQYHKPSIISLHHILSPNHILKISIEWENVLHLHPCRPFPYYNWHSHYQPISSPPLFFQSRTH